MQAGTFLPLSLTRLELNGIEKDAMPQQVGQAGCLWLNSLRCCTGLHCSWHNYLLAPCFATSSLQLSGLAGLKQLKFDVSNFHSDGYEPLAGMASLTRLELWVEDAPSCLSRLTQLRWLTMDAARGDAEAIERALCQLQQLSVLYLSLRGLAVRPSALASLNQLRHMYLDVEPDANAALPPGTWLAQLQTVAAPLNFVLRSLPAVRGAAHLQNLVMQGDAVPDNAICRIVRWASEQPSLRQLYFEGLNPSHYSPQLEATLTEAFRNPGLDIGWLVSETAHGFFFECAGPLS